MDEANRWFRDLSVDETGNVLAALDHGAARPLADGSDGPAPRTVSSEAQPVHLPPWPQPYDTTSIVLNLIGDTW